MKTIIIIMTLLLICTVIPQTEAAESSLRSSALNLSAQKYLFSSANGGEAPESNPTTLKTPESYVEKWPVLRTTGEIVLFNLVMTMYGKYIMKPANKGFTVTAHSIKQNLKAGMEWDDNSFSANNFRHPVQGGLYFNAARSNGYDFFQSIPFAFLGSWLWEYTGEAHHPSYNDWVNTAIGGVILGEVMWRVSSLILDNTATGSGRAWRELGGFVTNPMRGVNRLFTGEAFDVHANPTDTKPGYLGVQLNMGIRTFGEDRLWDGNESRVYLHFLAAYGDPFKDRHEKPFDNFLIETQLNFKSKPKGIGWIGAEGLIYGTDVSKSDVTHHILGSYLHFDYYDNDAFTFGGQSLGGTFLSRFQTGTGFEVRTALHLNAILLGASRSDYFNISRREYDYGPGAGFKFLSLFSINGQEFLLIGHESHYIHSINGNKAYHYVNFTRMTVEIPLRSYFGFGTEFFLYQSERFYEELPDVSSRNPELKLYVSWDLD